MFRVDNDLEASYLFEAVKYQKEIPFMENDMLYLPAQDLY